MTNVDRIPSLWFAVALAVAVLVLPGCSDQKLLTPTGPAAPGAPSPGMPLVEIVLRGSVTDVEDVPVSGAVVTASGFSRRSTTVTDAAGQFTLQSDHIDASGWVLVSAQKAGYVTQTRAMSGVDRFPIKLPLILQLPVDGSMAAAILAADPPTYVGEAYESDYSSNTKYFSFTIPVTADLIVEIAWEGVENSSLMMWAFEGTKVSERTGTGAAIRLPRGTTSVLLVGRPYAAGKLLPSQSVPFTLTTRRD